MSVLKVGLLGLSDAGADYLNALRANERFEVVAVADRDGELLRQYRETGNWQCYQDYRSVIVEAPRIGLDLLVVALEPFQSVEFRELAADRGIGVLHKAPWARNFREAHTTAMRFSSRECPFVVARPWHYRSNVPVMRDLLSRLGHLHLVRAELSTDVRPVGWRGDSVRSGGGVLLNDGYTLVDFLIQLLGVPDQVYARCCDAVGPAMVRNYDTEDAAVVTLSFAGDRMGALVVYRTYDKPSRRVFLVGSKGTASLSEDALQLVDQEGSHCGEPVDWSLACIMEALGEIAQENRLSSVQAVTDHLPTMAVIEAAYLSEKTGAPESPSQFLANITSGQ